MNKKNEKPDQFREEEGFRGKRSFRMDVFQTADGVVGAPLLQHIAYGNDSDLDRKYQGNRFCVYGLVRKIDRGFRPNPYITLTSDGNGPFTEDLICEWEPTALSDLEKLTSAKLVAVVGAYRGMWPWKFPVVGGKMVEAARATVQECQLVVVSDEESETAFFLSLPRLESKKGTPKKE